MAKILPNLPIYLVKYTYIDMGVLVVVCLGLAIYTFYSVEHFRVSHFVTSTTLSFWNF